MTAEQKLAIEISFIVFFVCAFGGMFLGFYVRETTRDKRPNSRSNGMNGD